MQIHRFDNVSSAGTPRPVIAGGNGATDPQGTTSRDNMAEGVGGGELEFLTRQFDGISEVRPEVVAAAKMRMQRGDYLSRAAAEQTAAAILSRDA
jgi:hypothetical protein